MNYPTDNRWIITNILAKKQNKTINQDYKFCINWTLHELIYSLVAFSVSLYVSRRHSCFTGKVTTKCSTELYSRAAEITIKAEFKDRCTLTCEQSRDNAGVSSENSQVRASARNTWKNLKCKTNLDYYKWTVLTKLSLINRNKYCQDFILSSRCLIPTLWRANGSSAPTASPPQRHL